MSKIPYRKIRINHSESIPRQLIFVDCETRDSKVTDDEDHEVHKLWFGYASYGFYRDGKLTRRKEIVFTKTQEFWDWVQEVANNHNRTWIFAHNVGFDLTILDLLGVIKDGQYSTLPPSEQVGLGEEYNRIEANKHGLMIMEDPPTVISLTRADGGNTLIVDTLNYWRTSLKMLGQSVGLDKLDMPPWEESYETWVLYCKRDVEIIELAITRLIKWWKEHKLGKFGFTSPSLAMAAFRHMNTKIDILAHQLPDVRELERDSYFGGQLEAYYIGKINHKLYQYDVASLYPSVMKGKRYPVHLKEYNISDKATTGFPIIDPWCSIANVFICSPEDTFPIRVKEGVLYMNGDGWVTLAGAELGYAYAKGYIFCTRSWATYVCKPIFNEFVDYFWNVKIEAERNGDHIQRTFAKLLLNSLYGKFAQLGAHLIPTDDYFPPNEYGYSTIDNLTTDSIDRYLNFFDLVFKEVKGKELAFSVPAISAFVTAHAREHMRSLKEIVGKENYYYMSTDSLMVNELGRQRLTDAGEIEDGVLGKLTLEAEGIDGWIGGCHFYRIGDKMTEGSKKVSAETIDKFTWKEPHFDSLKTVIQRGGKPEIHIKKRIKKRNLEYRKGELGTTGSITPWRLDSIGAIRATSTASAVQIEGF